MLVKVLVREVPTLDEVFKSWCFRNIEQVDINKLGVDVLDLVLEKVDCTCGDSISTCEGWIVDTAGNYQPMKHGIVRIPHGSNRREITIEPLKVWEGILLLRDNTEGILAIILRQKLQFQTTRWVVYLRPPKKFEPAFQERIVGDVEMLKHATE